MKDMILIGLNELQKKKKIATFESLVKKCFNRYPEVFGLGHFPSCPDTLKFDRPLRELRQEGFIEGHIRTSFKLTEKGMKFVKFIESIKTKERCVPTWSRTPEKRILEEIKSSLPYYNYKTKGEFPNEMAIKNLLHLSAEASLDLVRDSLEKVANFAKELNEKEVKRFIQHLLTHIKFKKER